MEKHIKELSAHLVVLKSFYGKLTPEQQKVFDTESWPRGPRDRRGGSRGDRRGPPRD
ncbi:MAG: Spy/CpxP family protein refolding chaperone [Burkholderiaceae bacterium]|nr:Spy/CpxP family protein refolding chaperone [Burkholderiaceae bacterium]